MIQARNLTKYYGSHLAVDRINFSVEKGEILGLLGPNGAGKTTTMRMATGFLRPTAGQIIINGHDIEEEPLAAKELIGYLPEFAPLYPEMMVYDYLRFAAKIRGIAGEKIAGEVERVCDLCGLRDVMHQAFQELSRGYRQRVGLAHAIIGDPAILILDEPTSGLDPNQIVEIRSLIRNVGSDKTVIFSTHVLSEAEATCDRIVIIHRGRIAADSSPTALKETRKGGSILSITFEDVPFAAIQKALSPLQGVAEVSELPAEGKLVRARVVCDEEARRTVYRRLKSESWMLLELTVERHSMEDAFRALTEAGAVKGKIHGR